MSQIRLRILGESVIQVGETTSSRPRRICSRCCSIWRSSVGSSSRGGSWRPCLFPEASAANAGHNLRQLLYRLRRMGVPLEATAAAVKLPAESVVEAPESASDAQPRASQLQSGSTGFVLLPSYSPPTAPLSAGSRHTETDLEQAASGPGP